MTWAVNPRRFVTGLADPANAAPASSVDRAFEERLVWIAALNRTAFLATWQERPLPLVAVTALRVLT